MRNPRHSVILVHVEREVKELKVKLVLVRVVNIKIMK